MNKVEMPEYERIVHPKKEPISEEQQLWYQLLGKTSDIIHNAMVEFVDSFKGDYLPFRLSEFFGKLNAILERYLDDGCENRFLMDEFVQVAYLAQKALKHIVSSPSTKIVHVDTKVHAARLRNSNTKTMGYLAKRSGQTIFEKIAPDNKILTTRTQFSVDTIENRQSLYLWDYLYNNLESKFRASPCAGCKRKDKPCYQIAERINGLLRLKTEIRKSELYSVKKVKQSKPNNKLICDKYYKLVWDSSKLLNDAEGKITNSWEFLQERYETLIVWFVIARLLSHSNVQIVDRLEELTDNGRIAFKSGEHVTLVVDEGNHIKELTFMEVDDKYVCRCVTYIVNSRSVPKYVDKELTVGAIIEEFFKEKEIDDLRKKLEMSIESVEEVTEEMDASTEDGEVFDDAVTETPDELVNGIVESSGGIVEESTTTVDSDSNGDLIRIAQKSETDVKRMESQDE